MQDETTTTTGGDLPLWRRIINFPLVAMLIALTAVIVPIIVVGLIVKYAAPRIPGLPLEVEFDLVSIPILLLIYKFVVARLGEHPRDDFRDRQALRHLLIGLGAGLLIFSLAVAVAAAMGVYRVRGEGDLSGLLVAVVTPAVFPAISEEMVFRGILFRWIEDFGGSWAALILTSALFGCAHLLNPHASIIAAIGIAFEAGAMLGAAYMVTRSLWMPMGLHAAWNFAQGEIYDIPVSGTPAHGMVNATLNGPPLLTGNGFGLEASVIAMVVATLFGMWLIWIAVRDGRVMQPLWVRRRALV